MSHRFCVRISNQLVLTVFSHLISTDDLDGSRSRTQNVLVESRIDVRMESEPVHTLEATGLVPRSSPAGRNPFTSANGNPLP
jgi:hypothetical protein